MSVFVRDEAADYEACPLWAARCACPSVLLCWFGIPEAPAAAVPAAAVAQPRTQWLCLEMNSVGWCLKISHTDQMTP